MLKIPPVRTRNGNYPEDLYSRLLRVLSSPYRKLVIALSKISLS
jgi:hypothetical protein